MNGFRNALRPRGTIIVIGALAGLAGTASTAQADWVGAWSASPSNAATTQPLERQTVRMIVSPHLGGTSVRIRLSNRFGTAPITLGPVTVANRATGADVVPGTVRGLTFGGASTVSIPAGGEVTSDAVRLPVVAFGDLAISVAVPGSIPAPTEHAITRQTNYVSAPGSGNQTGDEAGRDFSDAATGASSDGWYFLDGVDVQALSGASAVVAFGDSLTDGVQAHADQSEDLTTSNANARYPDALARRLNRSGSALSVLNAGIGGNRILRDGLFANFGPQGIGRFGRDALDQPGVSTIIVLEGINDIMATPASAPEVIGGLRALVSAAHAAGKRVVLGTLTPFAGFGSPPISATSNLEATRQAVNVWVRSQTEADAVADFDAAVRDPANPTTVAPNFDGGDHLHLSPSGYEAMAAVAQQALAFPFKAPENGPRVPTGTVPTVPSVPIKPIPSAGVKVVAVARQSQRRPLTISLKANRAGRVLITGRVSSHGISTSYSRSLSLPNGISRTVHISLPRKKLDRVRRVTGHSPAFRVSVSGLGPAVRRTITVVR